jgi:hypothetical protein
VIVYYLINKTLMGRPPKKSISVTVSEGYSTPTAIDESVSADLQPQPRPKRTYNIDPVKRQERRERRMNYINEYHRHSAHLRRLCEDIQRSTNVNDFTKALDALLTKLNKKPGLIHCCWDMDQRLKQKKQKSTC